MYVQGIVLGLCLLVGPTLQAALTANNVVEVYFLVDRKAINRYEGLSTASTDAARLADAQAKVTADIDYLITEVNTAFSSLNNFGEYSVNIKIAKRKLVLLDNNVFSGVSADGETVLNTQGLTAFDDYLKNQGDYESLKYDLALLWTGYDIQGSSGSAGFAYVGTVCQGEKATSIVEFDGTYRTVVLTAHELAHNLGASHDSGSAGYVMAPTAMTSSDNRWSFSLCTASDVSGVIGQLENNCLLTTDPASVIPNSGLTDSLRDLDSMCQQSQNSKDSYMCLGTNFYGGEAAGDAMCKTIYCYSSGNQCSGAYTPDGVFCGTGKACRLGKCVADSSPEAQAASDTCIHGDQQSVDFGQGRMTCSEFLTPNPSYCQYTSVKSECCSTCATLTTGIPGCEFGDGHSACSSYTPTPSFCSMNGELCCETCHGVTRKRSTDTDGDGVRLEPEKPPVSKDEKDPNSEGEGTVPVDPHRPQS